MRAATAAATLVYLLTALCGCGSSGSSHSASTGGQSSSGAERSRPPATIHVSTTPKFVAPPAGSPVRSGTVQVALRNIALAPDAIRVKVGTRIKWTNYDPVKHNVTSVNGPQRLHSGNFGQGGTYEVQLTRPGVIHYLCTIHPVTVNGTIEVVR